MERLFLDVINWSVCRYSLVCVSARAFLQFPNISTGDLICRFQSSSAKNIELTFQPSAGKVTELCLQLALTRGPWLICVDKAARRSPPSLPPPPSRTPSCVVNNSKCQSQADVTCAFLKKKNLSPLLCVTGRVPYMGKKARPGAVAICGSGGKCISCRGAAECSSCTVCPACAPTLCVQDNKAKILAVSRSETIPRSSLTALFNGSV